MRRIILFFLLSFLAGTMVYGQDHIYSQFYNAPIYLNPALNGQFEGDYRINMIYRNQWTNLPGPLNYYTFSADLSLPQVNGGVGLMITKSSEGTAYLDKINIAGIYSYHVELENGDLAFGLQAGMTNRKIDEDKLVFLDQLGSTGIIPGASSSAAELQLNHRFFFDGGAGINLVLGDFMIGASGQHLNKPNQSFTGVSSQLQPRYNGYASWKLSTNPNFEDSPSIIPSVVFTTQDGVNSLSAGMQYKNRSVNVGLWYRSTLQQQDAVVISVIFDLFGTDDHKSRFGLSHDITTSKLIYSKTAGTTEASFSYESTIPGRGEYEIKNNANRCYNFY